MMVLTAKVEFKKIILILSAVAAGLLLLIVLLGGNGKTEATSAPSASSNDQRVQFLKDFGWDVVNSPKESGQVLIPSEANPVFDRYNALQKDQGYDLSEFAGKRVMRYVYEVRNYPGAKEPVYATLLVYKNKVVGGDVTDSSAKGKIGGFQMPAEPAPTTSAATETTLPETTTSVQPSASAA